MEPTLGLVPTWVFQHVPAMVFLFCLGACVGSFLNVVIYRLPAHMSVITPPSRCPTCGARLRFFRENLPIIGWIVIRGRCRYCGVKVSAQYMFIELLMALMFVVLYAALFMVDRHGAWVIGGEWWRLNGVFRVWPAYLALAFMFAALVAMTIIDAREMTIPIQIPLFVTGTAFVAYPLQALLPINSWPGATWPIPGVNWQWFMVACTGMLGIVYASVLLHAGKLKVSFADYYDHVTKDKPDSYYPHARREMKLELRFLLPSIVAMIGGYVIGGFLPDTSPPVFAQAIGGTLLGYLVGGGSIWGIRILGTLVFGREAMGLGDVHLLGCIGAVLGWFDPILIFFIAPFSGIFWVVISIGASAIFKKAFRELPYGPHLAIATLIVVGARPAILWLEAKGMPGVPFPKAGLVATPRPLPTGGRVQADAAADKLPLGPSGSDGRIVFGARTDRSDALGTDVRPVEHPPGYEVGPEVGRPPGGKPGSFQERNTSDAHTPAEGHDTELRARLAAAGRLQEQPE